MGIDPEGDLLVDENTPPNANCERGRGYGDGEQGRRSPEKRQAACEDGFGSQEQARGPAFGAPPDDDEDGSTSPFAATQYPILCIGETQTRTEAALNLLNNLLGAGLLAMPKAFSHTGIFTGLVLMVAVALANRYTLLMLLEMSQSQLEDCSFPEIGRHVFGQKGLLAVLVAYLLFTGGILSAYLIAITDILQQLPVFNMLPRVFLVLTAVGICTPGAMLKSLRKVAVVSGVCMLGVCILVVVLTAVSVWDAMTMEFNEELASDPGRPGAVHWFFPEFSGLLDGACLFALQFSVQAGGIEVLSCIAAEGCQRTGGARLDARDAMDAVSDVEDMERQQEEVKVVKEEVKAAPDLMNSDLVSGGDEEGQTGDASAAGGAAAAVAAAVEAVEAGPGAKSMTELMRTPLSRTPPQQLSDGQDGYEPTTVQAAAEVSTAAFIAAGAFMAVIGVAGYLRFGDRVRGDVLLSFGARIGGDSSPALAVARFAYGVVVTCSFAFIVVPCRFAALDVFALRRRDSTHSLPPDMHKKVTAVILGVCALIACVISDLALMLEFVGVWSTMALSFVLPCSFLVELRRRQEGQRVLSRRNALPLVLIAFGVIVAAMGTLHILAQVFDLTPEATPAPEPEAVAIVPPLP